MVQCLNIHISVKVSLYFRELMSIPQRGQVTLQLCLDDGLHVLQNVFCQVVKSRHTVKIWYIIMMQDL